MPTNADLEYDYLGLQGSTGKTLADRRRDIYGVDERAFFSAGSGLAPAEKYSLSDHMLAYYRAQVDPDNRSLADTSRIFWEQEIAGGGPWTPADLPGLALWLDPADASTFSFSSSSVVSEWRDKSGNGHHFSQATVTNQPVRGVGFGGINSVFFDGTDNYLTRALTGVIASQPFSIVFVAEVGGVSSKGITDVSGSSGRIVIDASNDGTSWMFFAGSAVVNGPATPILTPQVIVMDFDGAASDIAINSGAPVVYGNPGTNTYGAALETAYLGSEQAPSKFFGGRLGDYIVVNGAVSAGDKTSLIDYLKDKWSIA